MTAKFIILLFLLATIELSTACVCEQKPKRSEYCDTDFLAIVKVNRVGWTLPKLNSTHRVRRLYFTIVDELTDIGPKKRQSIANVSFINNRFKGTDCDQLPIRGAYLIGGFFDPETHQPYVSDLCSGAWVEDWWYWWYPGLSGNRLAEYRRRCAADGFIEDSPSFYTMGRAFLGKSLNRISSYIHFSI